MRSRTCEGVKVQTAEAEKTVSWQTNSKTSRGTNCTVNLQVQTRLQGLLLLLRRRSRAAIGLLSALQFHSVTCSVSSSSNQKVNLQDKVHNQNTHKIQHTHWELAIHVGHVSVVVIGWDFCPGAPQARYFSDAGKICSYPEEAGCTTKTKSTEIQWAHHTRTCHWEIGKDQ